MTKAQVRQEAARRGFAVAAKPDSYDICFIPEGDTHGYLVEKLGARTGSVVDADTGEVLGSHDGYFAFTVGQRKGIRTRRPAPDGRPRYVLGIEPVSGTVTVGPAARLDVSLVEADRVVFPGGARPVFPYRGGGPAARARRRRRRLRGPGGRAAPGDAGRAGAGRRARADGGALRRDGHRRRRCGHDRADRVTGDDPAGLAGLPADRSAEAAWHLGAATGVGSLPGDDIAEAARAVAGELPDLPYLPELPARGVGADMVGRAVGILVDLYAEVVPSGWRVTARPGRDHRRARDFLAWDMDAAQETFAGAPFVKTQVCGPWTLAAELELASGHRALTDAGAVDDLAASLTEGLLAHADELARRVPGAGIVVQIDEPALPAVLAGSLRTASGFGTVGAVPASRVVQLLRDLVDALGDRPTIVHCCAAAPPIPLLRAAGFDALSLDLTLVGGGAAGLDPIGEAIEDGAILRRRRRPGDVHGSRRHENAAPVGGSGPGGLGSAGLPAVPAR